MNTKGEIMRLAGLLSTARCCRAAVVWGVANKDETLKNTSARCVRAHGELADRIDQIEDSRIKGWALAKSLQAQVNILKPVVDMAAAGNTDPDDLQWLAVEAFEALDKHKET